ncbi:uncharacterized protein [Eurosta solidaginis]|uniref:uncharacterized protein n=1 Tax=Eurosta solidaginis TaxID=178769 RepID=UPI00353080FA
MKMELDIHGRRIRRKSRVRWTQDSVKFLLYLWKAAFSELQTAKKKWHIYIDMHKKMAKRGYHFNASEIKVKIHNLTNRYRSERRRLRSNKLTSSDWGLYKPLDYLFGNNETNEPFEWEHLVNDYRDPLDETQDGDLQSGDDGELHTEGKSLKMEYEDGDHHTEPRVMVEVESSQFNINFSSSEKEDFQSDTECVSNTKDIDKKQKPAENSSFRIIADRIGPTKNNTNSYKVTTSRVSNAARSAVIPERLSKQTAEKASAQSLNLARWELIQIQKDKTLKEMEYSKLEFEQKTEEHKLRLKHMEEEHQLRMQRLRNQPSTNENQIYESL